MENTSIHLCRVFLAVRDAPDWITSKDVAAATKVAERTARLHLLSLTQGGAIEQATVFPGFRYKLAPANKANRELLKRISDACAVLGLNKDGAL